VRILGSGATASAIQLALNDPSVGTVTVSAGIYDLGSAALLVPPGKRLVGTSDTSSTSAGSSRALLLRGGSTTLSAGDGALVAGLVLDQVPAKGILLGQGARAENCRVRGGGAGVGIETVAGWLGVIRDCTVERMGTGFRIQASQSGTVGAVAIENCAARDCNLDGFEISADAQDVVVSFANCVATRCNNGFRQASAWGSNNGTGHVRMIGCSAIQNNTDGFSLGLGHSRTEVRQCRADENGTTFPTLPNPTNVGVGFRLTGVSGDRPYESYVEGCIAGLNKADQYLVGTKWHSSDNITQ